ncbi:MULTISPECIES: hypothetical protein [Streptomyces]|uniref:Integral membrane protein n=1 Tax=Streptomyces thermoviolaceus subsp. thermoviolaceus TaxID=66860 RepID=A0ABX0YQX9_STRTL|nr:MULTISPECIES: hypothetical protein [Streptomyces]MCM3264189.1 hypothetical protein [Streptomyces thermoviolaceus]NJP13716.1 hypothetical protein [Streptomyces thermoviolaceus subsp. thermoviolaceus]RSR94902.1 hypothetical protein EF917_26585 [Streptomyces sp. WAC00469]WTD49345.1 hypothetical protein OG899_18620 [Streptomyces thermoviolaceus]GGV60614.1 hypothetical protein GCM10010499_01270 [Streptomyces thermoviolaceus subsp. apingens]
MRRTVRPTAGAVTGAALAVAAAVGLAAPAHGADGGAAAVRPPRAEAGAATGTLDVHPSSVVPGGQVSVNTKACGEKGVAAGDASAVGAGQFPLAPSAHEGEAIGQFRVPESAQPGTYEIVAECAEGGRQAKGDLVVTLTAAQHDRVQPHGSVKTGVGGALGTDPVRTAAGVAALAVAAAGGTWLLHRRARGDGI